MNRRTRTLVVVGLAVTLAMLASFGVYRAVLLASAKAPATGRHDVVVAATALPLGTLLEQDDLRLVSWPDDVPLTGSFTTIDEVVGRGVIAPLVANEPVVVDKVAAVGAGAGLPSAIPVGMLAISVRVDDVVGVAGFTVPGTHVDVVATVGVERDNVSRVVLSNVQVLAAGTNQEQTKTNEPIRATVVTLLVTPADAERLALAMNEGRISLALRNPLDVTTTKTSGVRLSSFVTSPAAPAPAVKPVVQSRPKAVAAAAPPPPPPYVVQVFRGAKRSDEVVK